MDLKIKKIIPKTLVNYGKHLPKAIVVNVKHGFPGRKLHVIGVTGTDGKTTTVNMIYQILKSAGKKASMISTINAKIAGKSYDTGLHVTSPEASDIQKFIKKALEAGDGYMVLEVSSHALEQFRVWGINFEIGVITNITSDHLDYHGSFENYLKAKSKLIKNVKTAVLNYDDHSFEVLKSITMGKVLSFGKNDSSDINPKSFPLNLKIPGDFNVLNAEAAVGVGRALNIEDKIIREVLENFKGISGRMEEIENNLGINVIVDFACSANAYQNVFETLRKKTKGKLIAVFGSYAERDSSKRPIIGRIAARLTDITILTDDDPRFEDRKKIMEEIAKGYFEIKGKNDKNLHMQLGREKAIELAFSLAKKGDTIALLGKGHEKSIAIGGKELPWSDADEARKAINKLWKKK
ncbi:MAG: UDP-N-acetylmuramoyl-L-alanyl-D-glutamate--2,6-diaminopimelate ligase [Candidatus Daviesbacteria bacterium]|nr:UDP-N-acetylmuramoyl-L-alanyl-D-glutamate--2,6-diaminopimelate ligase [Candidatus Daviesbacteria bacterium]